MKCETAAWPTAARCWANAATTASQSARESGLALCPPGSLSHDPPTSTAMYKTNENVPYIYIYISTGPFRGHQAAKNTTLILHPVILLILIGLHLVILLILLILHLVITLILVSC